MDIESLHPSASERYDALVIDLHGALEKLRKQHNAALAEARMDAHFLRAKLSEQKSVIDYHIRTGDECRARLNQAVRDLLREQELTRRLLDGLGAQKPEGGE